MPTKIVIHSFMRETGKTNIAAGFGRLLAARGARTGLVDADMRAPILHSKLGVDTGGLRRTLNDYLLGRCPIADTAVDVNWRGFALASGGLWLAPAAADPFAIRDALSLDFDVRILDEGIDSLAEELSLDVALVNAPAGLDELSLSCIALADALVVVLRLDKDDYQGTGVTIDLARGHARWASTETATKPRLMSSGGVARRPTNALPLSS